MEHLLLLDFAYMHLPEGPLRETSKKFHDLAHELVAEQPPSHNLDCSLSWLLLAKDAAVRGQARRLQ